MGARNIHCGLSVKMRIAFLCAAILSLSLVLGHQAEQAESGVERSVHPFEDDDSAASLFQLHSEEAATAFSQCGFQGEARNEGTPLVMDGKNEISSLKVPAGQCASLFTKAGYNSAASGEMLEIRGPMNVACLSAFKLKDGRSTWKEHTHSYKMGSCAVKPTNELASAAVKTAAASAPDLTSLAHAAEEAARGHFGSVVLSSTQSKGDGVAYPYDQHAIVRQDMQVMQTGMHEVVDTDEPDAGTENTTATAPYPYAEHPLAEETDDIEGQPNGTATGSAFQWEHDHLGDQAWKQFHLVYPHYSNPIPDEKEPGPADDEEDILYPKAKNSVGCDKLLGCREPPPPCQDKDAKDVCEDYVANGDCDFDFAIRDCKRSCGKCPASEGAISSDAYVGPSGHYYLGESRRRVGAGFGRRRRSPAPPKAPAPGNTTASKPEVEVVTHVKKVEPSILHPEGTETVTEVKKIKKMPCEGEGGCVALFVGAGGCKIWKSGGDPTPVAPKGCGHCADAAAEHCGMTKIMKVDAHTLPKPLEDPKEAASQMAETAKEATVEDEADVPAAVVAAVHNTVAEATVKKVKTEAHVLPTSVKEIATEVNTKATEVNTKATTTTTTAPTTAQAAATEEAADDKASAESDQAASNNDVAASSEVKATTAIAKAADAVGTDSADTAKAAADAAVKKAAAAEAAAEKTQTDADVDQATAATAQEDAAEEEEAAAEPTPPPTPYPKTEDEVISEEADSYAQNELKQEMASVNATVTADTLVEEDFSSSDGLVF